MFHVCDPLFRSSVGHLYASNGIPKASWKVRRHHRLLHAAGRCRAGRDAARLGPTQAADPCFAVPSQSTEFPSSLRLSPSLTTTHVVMIPTTQFSLLTPYCWLRMLSREARVGKRESSLSIQRLPEKAKRMPEIKRKRGTDCMSSLRHRKRGVDSREFRRSFNRHPRFREVQLSNPQGRLPPSCRPARVTPTAAARSVGQTSIICALVSERAASALRCGEDTCSDSAGLSGGRFLRLLFGMVRLRGFLLLGRGSWSS